MKLKTLLSLATIFIFQLSNVYSADVEIEMLNKLDKEIMVYSKKIVRVDVGQTVLWKSTDKGHNVQFIKGGVPQGVEKFKSRMNQDV